jgi:hypothetical protein
MRTGYGEYNLPAMEEVNASVLVCVELQGAVCQDRESTEVKT